MTRCLLRLMERNFRFQRQHSVQKSDKRDVSPFAMNENSTRENVMQQVKNSSQIIMLAYHSRFITEITGFRTHIIRVTTGWTLISRKISLISLKRSLIEHHDFISNSGKWWKILSTPTTSMIVVLVTSFLILASMKNAIIAISSNNVRIV